MFNELKLWNGGVNNVLAPHFIKQNEAVYVANADIMNGEITSEREKHDTGDNVTGSYATYYQAQDEVVSSTEDRFYVEWAGYLYWSNSAGSIKRYDGTSTLDIGSHTAPATAPTLTTPAAGILNSTYYYVITYTHDDVFESPPCAFQTVTPVNQNVLITYADTPPAGATHRNIYRSGGYNPTFNLVATTPIATATFTDNIHDFDLSRTELKTNNVDAPQANLDMMVEKEGTFFASLENKVYFSKEGDPEYWSDYNFVTLPKDVTGLGVFGSSVVAFTNADMYIIQGSNISNISLQKLPFDYGCKNKRTVQNIEGRLVWVTALDDRDAICVYDGSSVQIINQFNKRAYTPEIGTTTYGDYTTETYDTYVYAIQNSIVSNRKYFLFMAGRTAIVDVEDSLKVYYMEDDISGAYSQSNSLYVISGTDVYEYYPSAGTYRDIEYRTGDIDNGDLNKVKNYRSLKINAEGTYSVGVYVDDALKATVTSEKEFLPTDIYGKYISFLIESTGYAKIKSISYEYTNLKD